MSLREIAYLVGAINALRVRHGGLACAEIPRAIRVLSPEPTVVLRLSQPECQGMLFP